MSATTLNLRQANGSRNSRMMVLGALLSAAMAAAPGWAQLRTVTIRVDANVDPAFQELQDKYPNTQLPLEGCRVWVQAYDRSANRYETWGAGYLDSSGCRSFTVSKSNTARDIRAYLKFESADSDDFALQLYRQRSDVGTVWRALAQVIMDSGLATPLEMLYCLGDMILNDECTPCQNLILSHLLDSNGFSLRTAAGNTDWIPLYVSGSSSALVASHGGSYGWSSNLAFRRTFSGSSSDEARHANLWIVLRELLRYLDENDHPMNTKLHVVHPADLSAAQDGSFADPLSDGHDTVYLLSGHFDVGSAFHEAMHVWAYQHSTSEELLGVYLFEHCTTHGHVSAPVAFHEGFAEASKYMLRCELYPDTWGRRRPYNRFALNQDPDHDFGGPITNVAQMQRHDEGWTSFLLMLMTPDLGSYEFGSANVRAGSVCAGTSDEFIVRVASSTEDAALEFLELLDVVHGMNVNVANQVEFSGFLLRVATLVSAFDRSRVDEYLQLADPASTYEPDWAGVGTRPTDLGLSVELGGPLTTNTITGARSLLFVATVQNVHDEERSSAATLRLQQALTIGGATSTTSTTAAIPALEPGASREVTFTVALPASGSGGTWEIALDWDVSIDSGQCDENSGPHAASLRFGESYLAPDYVPEVLALDTALGAVTVKVTNAGPVAATRSSVLRVTDYESGSTAARSVPALSWGQHRTYTVTVSIAVSEYEVRMITAAVDANAQIAEGDHEHNGDAIVGEDNNTAFAMYGGSRMRDLLTSTLAYAHDRFAPGFEPPPVIEEDLVEWSYTPTDWIDLYFRNSGNGPIDPTGPIDADELLQAVNWMAGRFSPPTNWVNEVFSQAATTFDQVGQELVAVVVLTNQSTRVLTRPLRQ